MAGSSIIRLLPEEFRLILYTQFDFKGEEYLVFEDYIELHRTERRKFHTLPHLQAIAANLKYLNKDLQEEGLTQALNHIIHEHFYIGFTSSAIERVVKWVITTYNAGRLRPAVISKRRIIFNPASLLTKEEKLSIVGRLTSKGKRITEELIYAAIEGMQDSRSKITYSHIAQELDCSEGTIQKNIDAEVKEYLRDLNRY
jgi:hypothetical protein